MTQPLHPMPRPVKPPLRLPEFVALFSLTTSLTALSIDAMLPALREIGVALAVQDANDTQLIVTLFILGMVFGEFFFGPVSDAIGRKGAILIGLALFGVGAVIAMTADSLTAILAGRVVQGIGCAGPKIAARALIRDQYEGPAMARILSFIFMVFIIVPMLAPALGQLIVAVASWRAIFLVFLALAAVNAVWLVLRQPETLEPARRIPFAPSTLAANGLLILRHGKVMAYTLALGFLFAALLVYVSTAPAMFHDLYGIDETFPMYFAIIALGLGIASFFNSRMVMRFGMHRLAVVALAGMIVFAGALLALTAAFDGAPPFAGFMVLCFLAVCCNGLLFGNVNALAMQSLGRVAGLGASMVSSLSSLVAVILSVSIGRFYAQSAYPLAAALLLGGAVALVLVLAAHRNQAGEV